MKLGFNPRCISSTTAASSALEPGFAVSSLAPARAAIAVLANPVLARDGRRRADAQLDTQAAQPPTRTRSWGGRTDPGANGEAETANTDMSKENIGTEALFTEKQEMSPFMRNYRRISYLIIWKASLAMAYAATHCPLPSASVAP